MEGNESRGKPLQRPPGFAGSALPALVLAALTVGLPSSSSAQLRWNVEARGGAVIPTDRLAERADPGITAGVGAGIWVWPKVGLRIDLAWERFGEGASGGGTATEADATYLTAGLEVHLLEPGLVPVTAVATANAGVTRVEEASGSVPPGVEDHAPTLGAGLAVGFDVVVGLNVFVKGEVRLILADGVTIQSTAGGAGQAMDLDLLGTMVSVPLTAGVRFDFFSR